MGKPEPPSSEASGQQVTAYILRKFNRYLTGYALGTGDANDTNAFLNQAVPGAKADVLCNCVLTPRENSPELARLEAITRAYQSSMLELVESGRYDTREDFSVVLQPFFHNTRLPILENEPFLRTLRNSNYTYPTKPAIETAVGARPGNSSDQLVSWRGLSWSAGGDGVLETHTTLPNILKKFNPQILGFSTGTQEETAGLNVAVEGASARDMPAQARDLVARMKNSPRGGADLTFFSEDCFHFSERGHAEMAIALWNNMLEPVGHKTTSNNFTYSRTKLKCPSPESPYLHTLRNSQLLKNQAEEGPNVLPWAVPVAAGGGLAVGVGVVMAWRARRSHQKENPPISLDTVRL
ncbi:Phospholipase B1, membrane-associated [Myotis brandtii]|uniref:Phospholipase B1, membrane-associated n=1 Tax=Myotis brandtii TaxID=109478 RepID=S7N7U7_MYOBR|nr:Phospholipase B1, membrane-associated [Myotis brandtii]